MKSQVEYNKQKQKQGSSREKLLASVDNIVELEGNRMGKQKQEEKQEEEQKQEEKQEEEQKQEEKQEEEQKQEEKRLRPADYLTVSEAADFFGVEDSTIYTWAQEGKITGRKLGRMWRFHPDKLWEDWEKLAS